jgi:hypothetical protein
LRNPFVAGHVLHVGSRSALIPQEFTVLRDRRLINFVARPSRGQRDTNFVNDSD